MKFVPILTISAALLGGCSVAQPDVTPIGDGLKAIGISLVVYGVMKALVDLMRADDQKLKRQPPAKSPTARKTKQPRGGEA